jgi:hypothetical protein
MYATKIFTELTVSMAFLNVDFRVRVNPRVKLPVFRCFTFRLASSWFLKGELVNVSDSFPVLLLPCSSFILRNGTMFTG